VVYRFEVLCLSRIDGSVIWQKTATANAPHEGIHPSHTYASGSPTTDGKQLYVSFGSQGTFCFTLDGKLVWQRDLGKMRTRKGWGEATTPVVRQQRLVINWDHEDDSSIFVLNTADGSTVWEKARPEEPTSWATPLVVADGERTLVVVQGTGLVRAYDLQSGDVVWSCGGQSVNAIPSPIRYKDLVVCMSGYRQSAAHAIPIGSKGDVTKSDKIRWSHYRGTPYVPSPVISKHRLYFTRTNTSLLSCLHADTGEPLYEPQRLPEVRSMYASPIVAGGHVYFVSRSGMTTVIKDSDQFEVVTSNSLDDSIDAAPVAIGKQLFLRSRTKLYCIEAP
jgi:outer membrane protein assembly factor BamB